MAEQSLVNMSENTGLGRVEIAPEVLEVIAGIAASEVDGLANMRGNFAAGVVERFGKKSHSKGVKVELTENGILIDLYVVLDFGVSIPEVAQKIQANIRQTLKNMTSLDVAEVNVHVVGLQMEKESTEEGVE
ncbi:Asp23/Gls24 family envelope stress response protein [Ornithinibacillus californiensis]|uniref:Asp23/Gls24 family envelope stress response protein n=1 Tax=Ornithinibacillus californiensis TaxID=161536 RepID=UPI00064DC145|nr:Asp23/Gls24 family envelope stress response protein [Ornithinibacillus californiensis]